MIRYNSAKICNSEKNWIITPLKFYSSPSCVYNLQSNPIINIKCVTMRIVALAGGTLDDDRNRGWWGGRGAWDRVLQRRFRRDGNGSRCQPVFLERVGVVAGPLGIHEAPGRNWETQRSVTGIGDLSIVWQLLRRMRSFTRPLLFPFPVDRRHGREEKCCLRTTNHVTSRVSVCTCTHVCVCVSREKVRTRSIFFPPFLSFFFFFLSYLFFSFFCVDYVVRENT